MAMKLNASNLFQFFTYISPFLLLFTFILIGFLNNEPLNSILYVGAVCISTFLVGLTQDKFNVESIPGRSPMCDLWEIPFISNNFNTPSLSTFFITFSSIYMLLPMFMSGSINYGIVILFALLFVSDIVSKLYNKCANKTGIALGFVFATVISGIITTTLYNSAPDLMFFTEKSSNNVSCGKPSKQKFKCSVYKNGRLLKEL
jgi:hypothetical protein